GALPERGRAAGRRGGRGRLSGHVRVRREHDLLDAVPLHASEQLVDPEVLWLDAVERRERAAEDVVEAAELVGPLERDEVDRLLDDADDGMVAARVDADRAQLLLREVAALAAEADALLHLLDRGGERERLVAARLEQVEREALRRSRPDPREARQLRDEVLDGGAEHGPIVPGSIGGTSGASATLVACCASRPRARSPAARSSPWRPMAARTSLR